MRWSLSRLGQAIFKLVDDGMDAGGPGAIEISAKRFDPEQIALTGGARVDAKVEDGLIGGADIDGVVAHGDDDEREIAWLAGGGDGLAEPANEIGELLAGEAVNVSMLDRDDAR